MYYQPEIETITRLELEKLQVKRLKETINIAIHTPFYSKILKERNLSADSICSIEDVRKLPFTDKRRFAK